jgi:predicted small lipoprotein YifL
MWRRVALAFMALVAVSALTGCGKKGPLELPNGRTANPQSTNKTDELPSNNQ